MAANVNWGGKLGGEYNLIFIFSFIHIYSVSTHTRRSIAWWDLGREGWPLTIVGNQNHLGMDSAHKNTYVFDNFEEFDPPDFNLFVRRSKHSFQSWHICIRISTDNNNNNKNIKKTTPKNRPEDWTSAGIRADGLFTQINANFYKIHRTGSNQTHIKPPQQPPSFSRTYTHTKHITSGIHSSKLNCQIRQISK